MCGIAGMVGAACSYETALRMLAAMQRRMMR